MVNIKGNFNEQLTSKSTFEVDCTEQDDNVLKIDKNVSITWHKVDQFIEMFPEYFAENLVSFR